jgi:hypothetical protein
MRRSEYIYYICTKCDNGGNAAHDARGPHPTFLFTLQVLRTSRLVEKYRRYLKINSLHLHQVFVVYQQYCRS